ncbi:ATP-binding cassette domain-containing protein [Plantactinospora sp. B24E8]|uniref:ATP-binding cassette domain-containing protein n=1 Tax=Plantactinospora sp. B24E8 TaxID=3153567 RepID=UPI00325F8920
MSHAIRAEGLVKRFGATTALAGVDLAVRTGSVFGLLGPNGAGKTTTVRVLATLLSPDAGTATVGGYDIHREAHQVRQTIGLTGQYASVDETLTGTENLLLIGRLLGMSRADARARARQLLTDFHLADAADRAAKTYSGGMRRRLDLAASLVGRPRLLFLDEPTTGLDPRSRTELWGIVRDLVDSGVTVLLTTQYLEEADQLADEIAVVDHGRVIAYGPPEELKSRVGGQTLVVRPADPADLPVLLAVLRDVTGAEPQLNQQIATVAVSGGDTLPAVVRRLDEAEVTVAELALRGASLDEVFLSLTGHRAEEPDADRAGEPERGDSRADQLEGARA